MADARIALRLAVGLEERVYIDRQSQQMNEEENKVEKSSKIRPKNRKNNY